MSSVMQFIGTMLVGVVTGILSGMFGVGGAVVSTPAVRALGATPLEAVGSTLPSILPSSISGTLRYLRDGLVRTRIAFWTCVFGVPASVGGSLLSDVVPGGGHVLMLATAGLVGFTAYRTAFPRVVAEFAGEEHVEMWRIALIGLGAGGLSGLLGVGGGILMVPAFSAWLGMPLKETVATSLACVGVFAIPGTITHALLGHINWAFAIPLCIGVIPGARIGANLTIAASDRTLRYAVGIVLAVIAAVYAVGEVLALLD
jgi:uncharacterized membrane protein YfcA